MSDLSPTWFVIYSTADGRVLAGGKMPKDYIADYPEEALPDGAAILEVDREPDMRAGEWIDAGALVTATELEPTVSGTTLDADGVDAVTISDLPNPCLVTITHSSADIISPAPETEVTDEEVVITCIMPGTITVRVTAPGYQTWTGTLDAV